MSGKPVRTVITVVMDLLIVLAVVVTIGLVVRFFGALSSTEWGAVVIRVTDPLSIPIGVDGFTTPYGGTFDVGATATIVALLAAEWLLSVARRQA